MLHQQPACVQQHVPKHASAMPIADTQAAADSPSIMIHNTEQGQPRSAEQDKQYLQARHGGQLRPATAGVTTTTNPCCSLDTSPTRSSRPATAASGRPCKTPDVLLSRPLSAQLKTLQATKQDAVQRSTGPTGGAETAAVGGRPRSRSHGRVPSSPKLKQYTPGPGDYAPKTDRAGMDSLTSNKTGSFAAADRYEGSYIEAFAKTIHSPGPIYYPSNDSCATSTGGPRCSSSGSGSSRDAATGLLITARCSHSTAGTWNKADVGTRELLLVHKCGCNNSRSGAQRQPQGHTCHEWSQQQDDSSDSGKCRACVAQGWSVPGPGSYDYTAGRDGRGMLLTQSCPAFTVPKSAKLVGGRHEPFISAHHARHENQGSHSPGPVYKPDLELARPGSSSPTMQARGRDYWEAVITSGRASSAKQILGHSPVSRNSKHLWGDGPRTHFGTASLDRWPGTFISEKHSLITNGLRYGAEPRYHPQYSQVDRHMANVSLSSGPEDRFDDKWLPGSGRLQ